MPPQEARQQAKEIIMKAMTMYRPNTIQNALSDFDRYFESFFGDSFLTPAAKLLNRLPPVDIRETETAYALDMELPGYDEKNIDIHVDGSSLSIASTQETAQPAPADRDAKESVSNRDDGTFILRERRMNAFSRSFKLPENADPEAVTASFKNGVLSLEIKKRAEAQKRSIRINAG
jgi:HSP20 family protein